METKEVAAWMVAEHEKICTLNDEIRALIARAPRENLGPWIADLRGRFDEFVKRLDQHMTIEEEDGYLAQVRELRPALSEAVDMIKHEHIELLQILHDIQAALHQLAPTDNLLVRDCCRRIEQLLLWIERHEEHENHIVMYTFTQDITAQD
ncbi:MAG: hemerythrin domain-containing protein [Planctomycetes bacterium]|nr:hemerythrin domain-containing protein [Planctomycetota bacterium]